MRARVYTCVLNVFRSRRTCVSTHVSSGQQQQQQLGATLRGDTNNADKPSSSRVVGVAARKDVAIARIRRAVRSEEKRRGSRAWCKENRRTAWAAGIMEFELDGSLKEWAKDKPLSILQLDPADRAVLRIAGECNRDVLYISIYILRHILIACL